MKKFFLFFMCMILLIGTISAFGEVKTFNEEIGNYGEIKIKDWLFLKKADYQLTNYDSSVINVWAEGKYKLYKKTHLFTGIFYKDVFGKKGSFTNVKFFIKVNESYQEQIIDENSKVENCELDLNGTKNCYEDYSYKNITKYRVIWKLYQKGDELKESEGEWRFEAERKANKPIDFVLEAHGKTFNEWAWFNHSWEYKTSFSINSKGSSTLTNFPAYIEIDTATLITAGKMQSDCSDLRVLNSTENGELSYEIENATCDTSYTLVWFKVPSFESGNQTIYIYYGNNQSSDQQSVADVWSNGYYAVYHFAENLKNSIGTNPNLTGHGTIAYNTDAGLGYGVHLSNNGNYASATLFDPDSYNSGWSLMSITEQVGSSLFVVPFYDGTGSYGSGGLFSSNGASGDNLRVAWGDGVSDASGDTNFGASYGSIIGMAGSHNSSKNVNVIGNGSYQIVNANSMANNANTWEFPFQYTAQGIGSATVTEVRLSLVERTSDWMKAELSQDYFVGVEEQINIFIVTSISPIDNYNSSSTNVQFNCTTLDDTGIYSLNLTINGTIYETITGDGTENLTLSSTESLSEGVWVWNCTANDDEETKTSTTKTLEIETISPEINIASPLLSYNYTKINQSLNLNWTVIDSHIDSCWYDYNGTNISLNCQDNYTTFNVIDSNNSLTFYANDTFGNLNFSIRSWEYLIFENSVTYSNETYKTAKESFEINISLGDTESISAYLVYNGTSYLAIKTGSSQNFLFNNSPPLSKTGNISFYWNFDYGGEIINSPMFYQNVETWEIGIDQTYEALKINIMDEKTEEIINQTALTTFANYYLDEAVKQYYSNTSEAEGEYSLGVSTNEINSFFMDTNFRYSSEGYQQRNYYNLLTLSPIDNKTLDLYLLLKDEGTIQFFRVSNNDYGVVVNAKIEAYRLDGLDEILVDAMLTDDDGEANLFLNPDEIHKIKITKDGCTPNEKTIIPTGINIQDLFLECGASGEGDYNLSSFYDYGGLTIEFFPKESSINPDDKIKVKIEDTNCLINSSKLIIEGNETLEITSNEPCGEDLELSLGNLTGYVKATIILERNQTLNFSKVYFIYSVSDYEAKVGVPIVSLIWKFKEITDFGLSQNTKIFIAFIILFSILCGLSKSSFNSDSLGSYILIWIYVFIMSLFGFFEFSTTSFHYLNKYSLLFINTLLIASIIMIQSEN